MRADGRTEGGVGVLVDRRLRQGAVRIETTGSYPGVRVISFKTPEGKVVSELMNSRKEDVEVAIAANGRTLPLKLPGVSITTAIW